MINNSPPDRQDRQLVVPVVGVLPSRSPSAGLISTDVRPRTRRSDALAVVVSPQPTPRFGCADCRTAPVPPSVLSFPSRLPQLHADHGAPACPVNKGPWIFSTACSRSPCKTSQLGLRLTGPPILLQNSSARCTQRRARDHFFPPRQRCRFIFHAGLVQDHTGAVHHAQVKPHPQD